MQVLSDAPDPAFLVKCVYDDAEQLELMDRAIHTLLASVPEVVDEAEGVQEALVARLALDFFGHLVLCAATFKHPSFKEENEWRAVVRGRGPEYPSIGVRHRTARGRVVPFVAVVLPEAMRPSLLRDIVVGPARGTELAVVAAREFARVAGYTPTEVHASSTPFRDW